MEPKKKFYVSNRINFDVQPIDACTWYEAMDKAFAKWDCKIHRRDMFPVKQKITPSWQNHFSF